MRIAFPLSSDGELSFDFFKSNKVGIFDSSLSATLFISSEERFKNDADSELLQLFQQEKISHVVSPYYTFKTLRLLKESGLTTLQSSGRNVQKNIELCCQQTLPDFDVSESFIVESCGTTCAECTLPCKG